MAKNNIHYPKPPTAPHAKATLSHHMGMQSAPEPKCNCKPTGAKTNPTTGPVTMNPTGP